MLYAKISPAAEVVIQDGPFSTKVESLEFVTIFVINYAPGSESTIVVVRYGKPEFRNDSFLGFNASYNQNLTLTAEQLSTWGTDDTSLFEIVAENQGFEIVEFFNTNTTTTTTTTTSL